MIGKVKEVFIPNDIYSKQIGFKITLNDKILEVIEEQDEYNANIFKDDLVIVNMDEKNNITIDKYDGDIYES